MLAATQLLADQGRPSIAVLMIAAAAELVCLVVLHIDKDFETIAEVTGQAVERFAAVTPG